jgi:hypothetical protein
MESPIVNAPMCQSCGLPLPTRDSFGTEADGRPAADLCKYCYQDGAFVNPGMDQAAMLETCVGALAAHGMPAEEARALMAGLLPTLRRWRR